MKTISREEIRNLQEPYTMVNSLKPESYEKVHIPDSVNIPTASDEFEQLAEKLIPDKQSKVITYCASPD